MRALTARHPALHVAHVDLGVRETPLEEWRVAGVTLLIKRDDTSAFTLGGNKVRALEFLLAGVAAGTRVLTVGATGSTHALAVARYAAILGASAEVITWPQETHAVAERTARALAAAARVTAARSVADAYARALVRRLRGGARWIPSGGSVALGALGHVSAALELAAQVEREGIPAPAALVVPLGSGGTVAGLLVGLAMAGLRIPVVGVQVVPRVVASRPRVDWLVRRTRTLVERATGIAPPVVERGSLTIQRDAYGGAYGRETAEGREAAESLRRAGGPAVDPTYSAKALAVAVRRARSSPDGRVLFWLTFDGRWLGTDSR